MALWVLNDEDMSNGFNRINHNSHLLPYLKRKRIPIEMYCCNDFEKLMKDPEAVLYIPNNAESEHTELIKKCNLYEIPVICVDTSLSRGVPGCYFSSISDNDLQTVSTLVSYCEQYGRERIAFFGANPFYVDLHKISTLYDVKGSFRFEDAYMIHRCIEECFNRFFENRDRYDAVVCANDIIAVYFIKRMTELDPEYVERTFIISFMDTVLSQLFHRSLTSISYDRTLLHSAIYSIYRTINKNRTNYNGVSIALKGKIFPRETTLSLPYSPRAPLMTDTDKKPPLKLPKAQRSNTTDSEPLVLDILNVERLLQTCDIIDLKIIYLFLLGCSNEETSSELFISLPTIKYRSGELFKIAGVKHKKLFVEFIRKFVDEKKLKNYIDNYKTDE